MDGNPIHGQSQNSAVNFPASTAKIASSKGQSKQYVCKHEGCSKSFTRSDHLQRHGLNHSTGKSTCLRCSVHFNRPDLLDRHMARHKKKDDEAGGYGLGVMETRKRMWRDADGNIVAKRPTLPNNNPAASSMQNLSSGNHYRENSPGDDEIRQYSGPLSPPTSMNSEPSAKPQHQLRPISNMIDDQWDPDPLPSFYGDPPDMCEFLENSSWGSQPFAASSGTGDDIFNPDTASSFNMPFTTMNNYNWLFDVGSFEQSMAASMATDLSQNQYPHSFDSRSYESSNVVQFKQPWAQEMISDTRSSLAIPSEHFSPQGSSTSFESSVQGPISSASIPITAKSVDSVPLTPEDSSSPGNFSGQYCSTLTSRTSVSDIQTPPRPQPMTTRPLFVSAIDPLRTFSQNSGMERLPVVDELTRHQILDMIVQANTKTPEGGMITRDHPLLSLSALQNYCDLFFCKFNITYPLLHQATFEPSQVEPLLLISILLLGATYGDKAGHQLAVCIHDVLRTQIFQNAAFKAQPDLWILQTILLVECFGKSRAGQTQHDMSHLFHGLLINLIRRSNCQTVSQPSLEEGTGDLECDWKRFVDVEQRKRLALLCFLWDTQHAVLFSQSLCMSAFELRLSLPCNPATWEAESADQWYKNFKNEKDTSFLSVLKIYVNPGSATPPAHLNALSRLLILHGLMSISWDMKRREQTSLGFTGPTAQDRQTRLAESYDAWRADFDTYCMSMTMALRDNAVLKKNFMQFSTASIAIFHAAHIILNVEILDLQIYAGARHIIGRPVTRTDYDRSRRILKQWAQPGGSPAAVKASWHAAHLLRDGIMNLDGWDVNDVFHYPWCLYLATLTCWGFHFAAGDKNDKDNENTDAMQLDDIVWDAQAEMNALVSGMTSVTPECLWKIAGKYATCGLTAVMGKHLSSIRWAVVHEGMKLLKGLVAERRINESLLR